MRRYDDPYNDLGPSSPHQSCPDCIIAMRGYDFREGQVYLTSTEGKEAWPYIGGLRVVPNGNVEVRFFAKITLNGEYLARLTMTRNEVAKLFLSQYDDCSFEELLRVINEVRETRPNRNFAPVLLKQVDEIGLSVRSFGCRKTTSGTWATWYRKPKTRCELCPISTITHFSR
jgi:hypothetical protein